jgi:hypothetical protein
MGHGVSAAMLARRRVRRHPIHAAALHLTMNTIAPML